jgi:hypothetical protein
MQNVTMRNGLQTARCKEFVDKAGLAPVGEDFYSAIGRIAVRAVAFR